MKLYIHIFIVIEKKSLHPTSSSFPVELGGSGGAGLYISYREDPSRVTLLVPCCSAGPGSSHLSQVSSELQLHPGPSPGQRWGISTFHESFTSLGFPELVQETIRYIACLGSPHSACKQRSSESKPFRAPRAWELWENQDYGWKRTCLQMRWL